MADPKYRQMADDLRSKIESGVVPHGSRLPTEIDLMEQYEASRNTVRDAIKLLSARGLVETRPGQGMYVVEKINNPFVTTLTGPATLGQDATDVYIAEVRAGGREPTASELRLEIQKANDVIADALRINPGEQVISRHQERYIDGTPWSLQTSFYPMTLATEGGAMALLQATDIPLGAVEYLAQECGIKQVGYRDSIAVRAPDENEAKFFKLSRDGRVSVFVIFRVGFTEGGKRFRLTISVYPADRNRFLVNVGDVPVSQGSGGS